MSLTSTTVSRAVTAIEDAFPLTSVTGLNVGDVLKVNSEVMRVVAVNTTTLMAQVWRGQDGTFAVAHSILSLAVFGPGGDFIRVPKARIYAYGEGGAITVAPGLHILLGSTAAFTLAAPSADLEGMRLQIVAGAATAFQVTIGSGTFNNDGVSSVLDFSAAIGNSQELIVCGGYWCTTSSGSTVTGGAGTVTVPSRSPSVSPSISPSKSASVSPSASSSISPSVSPSATPSVSPSKSASVSPSASS